MKNENLLLHSTAIQAASRWQRLCFYCVVAAGLSACGATPLYRSGYEDSLERLYIKTSPPEAEERLRKIILDPDSKTRVPPGVYAEYGFLLLQRGDFAGAIANFENERRAFPESAPLMTKLIERSQQQQTMPNNK